MSGLTMPTGDPAGLDQVVDALSHAAGKLATHRATVKSGVETSLADWVGPREETFRLAGGGIQVEMEMLQSDLTKAAALIHVYRLALGRARNRISGWSDDIDAANQKATADDATPDDVKSLNSVSDDVTPRANAELQHLAQLASQTASALNSLTGSIVPGGAKLSPAQVRRRVLKEYGLTAGGGSMTPADAWRALKAAEHVVPKSVIGENGDVEEEKLSELIKEVAEAVNNHGPAQVGALMSGPLAGLEGWALTRYVRNVQAVSALQKTITATYDAVVGPTAKLWKAGLASMDDIDEALDVTSDAVKEITLDAGNPGSKTADLLASAKAGGLPESKLFDIAGKGLGALAIVGDVATIISPDGTTTTAKNIDRGMAAANVVGTSAALSAGLLAANASLDWVPVAGQALAVGTGVYLAGAWAYQHVPAFHDAVNTVGNDAKSIVSSGVHDLDGAKDAIGSAISHIF